MAKKARKLTTGELIRKEKFEAKVQSLTQQGYVKKDLTIGVIRANIMALVIMLPAIILLPMLYFAVNRQLMGVNLNFTSSIIVLLAVLALTVVHEGIHGITWACFAKEHFGAIDFGIIWSMLTPYCTCNAALTKSQYIIGGMMPTVIVGFIPAAIAIACNYPTLFFISTIMILCGGGDAFIILKLLCYKEHGKESIYMDHPYECGLVVFERTI